MNWREQAECLGADPTLFDPRDEGDEAQDAYAVRLRSALSYCADCPVLAECGADADAHGDAGVRGGRMVTASSIRHRRVAPLGRREALAELRARYGTPWGEMRRVAQNAGAAS